MIYQQPEIIPQPMQYSNYAGASPNMLYHQPASYINYSHDNYNSPRYPIPAPLNPIGTPATLFRYNTKKTIKLTPQGNFKVNIPVPSHILKYSSDKSSEFSHLTYTAVVGDPDEFIARGYSLRQTEIGRQTEIFIVVTMYNEDETLFLKTWQSLKRNIEHMCRKKNSKMWNQKGWQKIVICIVSDGRSKINKKTLAVIGLLGIYQEGIIKTSVGNNPVSAHLFEYTCALSIDSDYKIRGIFKN
jgi:chitin synthase